MNIGASTTGLVPVNSVSRREGVINEIRRAIIIGSVKPGQKLTEVQLAESLGVSRPTIREALNQLAQEGLLSQEPYKGIRVADMTAKNIYDIAETRVALDVLAVRSIYEDTSGRLLQQVTRAWEDYKEFEFDPDPYVRHEAHVAFHRGIWVASENSMLLKLWPVTEALMTISLAQDQMKRADPERAHSVHEALVEEVLSKDIVRAEAAFIKHTMVSAKELIKLMEEEGD